MYAPNAPCESVVNCLGSTTVHSTLECTVGIQMPVTHSLPVYHTLQNFVNYMSLTFYQYNVRHKMFVTNHFRDYVHAYECVCVCVSVHVCMFV